MRAAWVEVDLGAYRRNLDAFGRHTGGPVLAVVKANGYGHGMELVAQAAVEAGCPGVAVALPEEGERLRRAGFRGRILVMGLALEEQAGLLVEHDLDAVVVRGEVLDAVSAAAGRAGREARVHVKVDTGMSRVGVEPEEALEFCRRAASTPNVALAGVMTHFASADDEDLTDTRAQWERFAPLVTELSTWRPRPALHAANSAAALWYPPSWLDCVRVGLASFGVAPAPRETPIALEPVAAVRARIVQVKEVPAGRKVSYGGTWTAPRRTRLAVAPIGYADGVPWALGNRGEALVRGSRVPIRGRVCMDQVILDVTDVPPVEPGDEAVLVGRQGEEVITVEEWAALAGTIPYEVLTRLADRLPRVPVRDR